MGCSVLDGECPRRGSVEILLEVAKAPLRARGLETEHAIAVRDAFPIADGHTLVVPRKHVMTIYQLTIPEQKAVWELVGQVRERLHAARLRRRNRTGGSS